MNWLYLILFLIWPGSLILATILAYVIWLVSWWIYLKDGSDIELG